jgi:hypothetical protein
LNNKDNLSLFLELFDPSKEVIKVAGGDLEIRIDLISFILTGNQKINNDALSQRIPTIEFDKVSSEIKAEIINAAWKNNEDDMELIFDDKMSKDISIALEPFKDYVKEKDLDSAGCRVSLTVVQGLFSTAQLKYLETRGEEKFELDVDEIKELVAKSFKQEIAQEEGGGGGNATTTAVSCI